MLIVFRIRLVGNDKEPLDLSREDQLEIFQQSMGKWGEKMSHNEDNSKFGYVDIDGLKLEPFGQAYAPAS